MSNARKGQARSRLYHRLEQALIDNSELKLKLAEAEDLIEKLKSKLRTLKGSGHT